MMKFFRKYNKHLLAVFMVLLMIVFLGGSALESIFSPTTNRVWADSSLGEISDFDLARAHRTTEILSYLNNRMQSGWFDWRYPGGFLGEDQQLSEVDWVLLTREAELYGTDVDLAAARTALGGVRSSERIEFIAREINKKPDRIYHAVGQLLSIRATALAVSNTSEPSAAEIRAAARDALESVRVNAVVLPAGAFLDNEAEFTDEELRAQLEAHRETEPGTGLNFGYYIPPAVQVQYVQIERDKIADVIGVPNLEPKAKTYYEEHFTEPDFARPPQEQETPDDEAEFMGPYVEKPPYLEWEEAKPIAIRKIRQQYADKKAGQIAGWLADYTAEAWIETEYGEDRYKIAPPQVTESDYFEKVISLMPASIRYPEAVRAGETDFFTEQQVGEVPLLGQALARQAGAARPGSLGTLAFRTQAVVPKVPEEANRTDYLAMFQPCPQPLIDREGNIYLFRVADGKPAHPADSIEEVRERLIEDLRLLRGFEAARALAETLETDALDQGLPAAYDANAELQALRTSTQVIGFGLFTPPPFPRVPRHQAARGRQMGWTHVPDLGRLLDNQVDRCFTLAQANEKIALLELTDRATVMVIEWVETLPARQDEFEEMKTTLVTQLTDSRRREALKDWLAPLQIRARNRFEPTTGGG